jgi:hypothetical protein
MLMSAPWLLALLHGTTLEFNAAAAFSSPARLNSHGAQGFRLCWH